MRKEITEEQITELMQAIPRAEEVGRQRAEIEKLRADLALERSRIVLQRGEIEKMRAKNEKMRAALLWYADSSNHFPVEHRRPGDADPAVIFVEEPPIMIDNGRRARKALEVKP